MFEVLVFCGEEIQSRRHTTRPYYPEEAFEGEKASEGEGSKGAGSNHEAREV